MANLNRDGELGQVPSRSDRFFAIEQTWYFSTREGTSIGPYENRNLADLGLSNFLEFLALATPKTLETYFRSLQKH